MKPWFPAAAVLSAAVWLAGCVGGDLGAPFDETIDESRPLSAHGELSLENVNGKIRLTTWDEPRVRIEATKSAGSRRAQEVWRQ